MTLDIKLRQKSNNLLFSANLFWLWSAVCGFNKCRGLKIPVSAGCAILHNRLFNEITECRKFVSTFCLDLISIGYRQAYAAPCWYDAKICHLEQLLWLRTRANANFHYSPFVFKISGWFRYVKRFFILKAFCNRNFWAGCWILFQLIIDILVPRADIRCWRKLLLGTIGVLL